MFGQHTGEVLALSSYGKENLLLFWDGGPDVLCITKPFFYYNNMFFLSLAITNIFVLTGVRVHIIRMLML